MAFFDAFPTSVATLLQQKFLEREMQEGLDSILAYRRLAVQETFPGGIGETITKTRKGRKAPRTTPIDVSALGNNLDNGLTPSGQFSIEQYTITQLMYGDTLDLNLIATEAEVVDRFLANARNNGVQAAQTLERLCRSKLFSSYLSGNSRAIADPGGTISSNTPGALPGSINNAATNANYHLQDIRGFQTLLVSGVVTAVSTSNKLDAVVIKADGTTLAVKVQLATAHAYQSGKSALDITSTPDAIPGFLTLENVSGGTYTVAAGDALIAFNAPAVLRPNGRTTTKLIAPSDTFTLSLIEDGVAYMRDNNIPSRTGGGYDLILDNTSMRQLFADPDFKLMYQGDANVSEAMKMMVVLRLLGVNFIPTTEAFVQTGVDISAGTKIRRPILCGGDCLIQSDFEGMESWLAGRNLGDLDGNLAMIDGVVQIVREPLDRFQQTVAMSWFWIGDFAVPTDMTATSTIIPTASNALYKRCVAFEHAG